MDAQLRKVSGLALLFALVFGTVSAERAIALPAVACPEGDTIMVDTDTSLTTADADRVAMEADPTATRRKRTMQELFDCAIAKPGSTVQFADGTYDDVGRIVIGGDRNSNGDDPNTPETEKVTFSGNSANREAVKFTGEVSFSVQANNISIEHITFENTENIEMLDWPHVPETIRIEPVSFPSICRKNVEIRNCVFRNTRRDGVFHDTARGKAGCTPSGFTVADSLFENIGYNNEWEDGFGPGDTGTGIPKLIPATVEGVTTHKSGTTPQQVNQSRNAAIRVQGSGPIEHVTITGNTINGTTHSGIIVHRIRGASRHKIEISNNIVSNVPRSGIHVLEESTTSAREYSLVIKNNLVVNSGNSPWLVSDYDWYAEDGYSEVKSILGGGTAATDKVADSVLKPEVWSITENIVKDGTTIFASQEAPVNIYDNFGGAGNPTNGRANEYTGNGNRVVNTSSKIPQSKLFRDRYSASRADSCIEDDDSTTNVEENTFACFSVIRFLDPYAAGAIQLNGVSTTGDVEIMENELRDNTLGLVLCGGSGCYFNSPYSAVAYANNAAYAKPDISMNNIYGESAMSADDRAELPMEEFATGAVYASIGDLTEKLDLNGNYLGQNLRLFTDTGRRSLSEASEYTLETARIDIQIPIALIITAAADGALLTLTYSKTLDEASVPAASDFTVMVGDEERDVTNVSVSGAAVTITLASAVETRDAVTVSYTPGENPIRDMSSGQDVPELTDRAVINNTPLPPPTPRPRPRGPTGPGPVQPTPLALTSAAVAGDTLTITYNKTLDEASVPAASDFTVMVGGEGRDVDAVSVSGAVVTLTLARAVEAGDEVTVSYTPGENPIRDASGENAAALTTDRTVSNNTSRPSPPGGGGGCALASGGSGVGLGMLLALIAVPFGFAAGRRAREAR